MKLFQCQVGEAHLSIVSRDVIHVSANSRCYQAEYRSLYVAFLILADEKTLRTKFLCYIWYFLAKSYALYYALCLSFFLLFFNFFYFVQFLDGCWNCLNASSFFIKRKWIAFILQAPPGNDSFWDDLFFTHDVFFNARSSRCIDRSARNFAQWSVLGWIL